MRIRRTTLRAFGVVAVLACLAAAAVVVVVARGEVPGGDQTGRSSVRARPTPSLPPPPPRTSAIATTGVGPAPPARSAWFGATVQARSPTMDGRAEALDEFEEELRRPLAIVNVFHPWDDPFPDANDRVIVQGGKLLMISWAGTDTRSISTGRYDALIRDRALAVRDLKAPVLLRFRWEMDRPNLQPSIHSPRDFVAAWRHVRSIFVRAGATNAAWVWCPLAAGFADRTAERYYPGDDQVDYVGADAYPGNDRLAFGDLMTPVMAWARRRPRPVIVAEFGVQKGDPSYRAHWLRDVRAYVSTQPQIKGVVYFLAKQPRGKDYTFDGDVPALSALRALAAAPQLSAPAPGQGPTG